MRKTVRGLIHVVGPSNSNDEHFGNWKVELGALGTENGTSEKSVYHIRFFDPWKKGWILTWKFHPQHPFRVWEHPMDLSKVSDWVYLKEHYVLLGSHLKRYFSKSYFFPTIWSKDLIYPGVTDFGDRNFY